MQNYTVLEKAVFNSIVDICVDSPEADVEEISIETGLNKATVKGVVGSLAKKELIHVGEDVRDFKAFKTINPLDSDGSLLSFMCDTHEDEEVEAIKIK